MPPQPSVPGGLQAHPTVSGPTNHYHDDRASASPIRVVIPPSWEHSTLAQ